MLWAGFAMLRSDSIPVNRPGGPAPARIVSGGQTGADRAALDAAMALGIPCGGWCPRGRLAEDGTIDPRYPLTECDSPDPDTRTRLNVRDSDATLILARGELSGGTELTREVALGLGRPVLVADPSAPESVGSVMDWMAKHLPGTLNVAGPRESKQPGSYLGARRFLESLWGPG